MLLPVLMPGNYQYVPIDQIQLVCQMHPPMESPQKLAYHTYYSKISVYKWLHIDCNTGLAARPPKGQVRALRSLNGPEVSASMILYLISILILFLVHQSRPSGTAGLVAR
jgi:hypothetical protein